MLRSLGSDVGLPYPRRRPLRLHPGIARCGFPRCAIPASNRGDGLDRTVWNGRVRDLCVQRSRPRVPIHSAVQRTGPRSPSNPTISVPRARTPGGTPTTRLNSRENRGWSATHPQRRPPRARSSLSIPRRALCACASQAADAATDSIGADEAMLRRLGAPSTKSRMCSDSRRRLSSHSRRRCHRSSAACPQAPQKCVATVRMVGSMWASCRSCHEAR
jgi:hypothetical protein